MPLKRKRCFSGRSSVSNKSPRKANLNASAEEQDSLLSGETNQFEKIFFTFEGGEEECEVQPLEELACLSGEESECENKKPVEKEQEVSHCLLASPLKRASPLSPTLFDNVLQTQTPTVPAPVDTTGLTATPTSHIPKTEEEQQPAIISTGRRSKRRRIFSGTISEVKLSDADEVETPLSRKLKNVKRASRRGDPKRKTTSQKPADSDSTDTVALPVANYRILDDYELEEASPEDPNNYRQHIEKSKEEHCRDVMYELDEMDLYWLEKVNVSRTQRDDGLNLGNVEAEEMELLLDRFEKESYYELQNSGMGQPGESDEDAVCCICLDGESDNSNLIIFCDMCNIPVHQDCFGVPFIPEGSWLCRRCSICPDEAIECIFCPNKDGAFKKTVDGRWSHVLCALCIPEVRFANPSLVEPVEDIHEIPSARWKLTCFLCKKKGAGACIQCHLRSCVTAFHATCGQAAGLKLKWLTTAAGVRMTAFCDRHTSDKEIVILKQKIETMNKVLSEKRAAPPSMQFPSISANRIAAITELVTFPGKQIFMKRLLAYWKLKRKSMGGAPFLRNLESLWIQDRTEPPAPPKLEREECDLDPEMVESCYEKMKKLKTTLTAIKSYSGLIKDHSEQQREARNVKFQIDSIKMRTFHMYGINVYLDILSKLRTKDKHGTFAEPVTEDDAPDYFNVISTPMDLSTMREKSLQLEYSTIDDLQADFSLMINNCMTYNKKSTPYYKDAVKLQEYGNQVFEESRLILQQQSLDEEEDLDEKPSVVMTDDKINELAAFGSCQELKYHPLQGVLISVIEQLARHDKNGFFAEPVDVNESPDYLTIISKPMDFSTMRNKVNRNQYSAIEELEVDYYLMINNCLQYNEEKTIFYKVAKKLNELGKQIFQEAKHKHYMPDVNTPLISKIITENNNVYKTESNKKVWEETPVIETLSEVNIFDVMSDVLKKLMDADDEEIFLEPVTDDDAPGYSEIIKSPMDLSLIEKNLKIHSYKSLEDMEKDFILMINNCKRYNSAGTKYHNYAVKMRRTGNSVFNAARKLLAS